MKITNNQNNNVMIIMTTRKTDPSLNFLIKKYNILSFNIYAHTHINIIYIEINTIKGVFFFYKDFLLGILP